MTDKIKPISFIYFDVGGVIVKDFSATDNWQRILVDLGVPKEKRKEVSDLFEEFENEVCVGRNVEEFVPILRDKFGIIIPKNYSLLGDFVNRFSRNIAMEGVLKEIKDKFSMGLLTNMYPGMFEEIKNRGLLPEVDWKVVVDSSKVKCKKPEKEIFILAEKMAETKPESILFVDNTIGNIETGIKMGWKTYWYDSKDDEKSSEGLRLFLK
jgi:FMN phosphatase YigB (HAD superfamily)